MIISDCNPKILLTSSLTTGRRFVKKQNLNDVALMNFDIFTPEMLVKEKLIKLKPGFRLLSNDESAYIVLTLIQDNDYGLKQYVTSFGAASKLLEVLNDYRYNENSGFTNLVKADYRNLLKDYLKELESKSLIDYISALSLLLNNKQKEDCYVLDDLYLRPLEQKVFKSMFNGFENVTIPEKEYHVSSIYKCYGQYNEVANLLDYISSNNIQTGDIEVLYTDSTYENIIKGLCSGRGAPYTLKSNHAKSSNFVSFIYDILNYFKNDYKYEVLEGVLSNQGLPSLYLKEFYKTLYFPEYVVGFSKERSLEFIRVYQEEHPDKAESFINFLNLFDDIVHVTDNGLDYTLLVNTAKKYIEAKNEVGALTNQLMNLQNLVDLEKDTNKKIDLILSLLDKLTYNEGDNDNKVSFSKINKSFTLRKNIFVLGCNQTFLVGSDVENAFIEDVKKYQDELNGDLGLHTALYQRNIMLDNLKYYLSHSDASIALSYSCFDKVNLKDMTEGVRLITSDRIEHIEKNLYYTENQSVQFLGTLKADDKEDELLFDNGVVNPLEEIREREPRENEENAISLIEEPKSIYTLSPSDVQNLIECPFRFYYQKIFGIPSVCFPRLDETTWLEANTKGTMFHEIMEFYFNNYLNKPITAFDQKNFDAAFKKALANAEAMNPVNNEYIHQKEVADLKTAAEEYLKRIIDDNFFDKYKVLKCEFDLKWLNCLYKKEEKEYFKFSGVVDRIDGYVEDNVLHIRIVDYKTGKRKTRGKNPYYQHILYSYVLEKALGKNQFGLRYESVIVDEFIYSFALSKDKANRELSYVRADIDENSIDYQIVFDAINGVLLPYLDNEKDLVAKLNNVFVELHPNPKEDNKFNSGICSYCNYLKECIKKLEWGNKVW